MEIRVWKSFSCNNSSSYRLVARFADPAVARDVATELSAFFTTHAQQMDALMEDGDLPEEPTAAASELATKYGFEWKELLTWGDEMLAGDEPSVMAEGDTLVVYHTYCGGFGDDVPKYLQARGAREVHKEDRSSPKVSVLFRLPEGVNAALQEDLDKLFEQIPDDEQPFDAEPFTAPWPLERECYGSASFFRDAKTVGLYFPIDPRDLSGLKTWLAARGIENPSIRLCEGADEKRFAAIAAARCSACKGPLEYLDPRVHGIEKEHLACAACGGMFEVKTFLEPAT
jgi:hypothetical protein